MSAALHRPTNCAHKRGGISSALCRWGNTQKHKFITLGRTLVPERGRFVKEMRRVGKALLVAHIVLPGGPLPTGEPVDLKRFPIVSAPRVVAGPARTGVNRGGGLRLRAFSSKKQPRSGTLRASR